jgi:hypothetical protein
MKVAGAPNALERLDRGARRNLSLRERNFYCAPAIHRRELRRQRRDASNPGYGGFGRDRVAG